MIPHHFQKKGVRVLFVVEACLAWRKENDQLLCLRGKLKQEKMILVTEMILKLMRQRIYPRRNLG